MADFITNAFQKSKYIIGTILLISSIHWGLIFAYNNICINRSIWGFITNVVYMGSPLCLMINELQFTLSKYFITIMAGTTTSIITWFTMNAMWNNQEEDDDA